MNAIIFVCITHARNATYKAKSKKQNMLLSFKPILVGLEFEIDTFDENELYLMSKWISYEYKQEKALEDLGVAIKDVTYDQTMIHIHLDKLNKNKIDVNRIIDLFLEDNDQHYIPADVLYERKINTFGDSSYMLTSNKVDIVLET